MERGVAWIAPFPRLFQAILTPLGMPSVERRAIGTPFPG